VTVYTDGRLDGLDTATVDGVDIRVVPPAADG
jgi:hypothetical protein